MKKGSLLLSIVLLGCTQPEKKNDVSDKIIITYHIPRFEVDKRWHTVLMEIIKDQNQCLNSNPGNTAFSSTHRDYDGFFDVYFEDCDLNSINPNADVKIGYFLYSGRIFIFDILEHLDLSLSATNDTTIFLRENPKRQYPEIIDDHGSQWVYRCENREIILIEKSLCKD
jgi:hypothetical protein